MDIDTMQKINRLAKELFQHGIASDMEEATKQAELMINRGDGGISEVMSLGKNKGSSQAQNTQNTQNAQEDRRDDVMMELRKLGNQLNEQSKVIKTLKEQLDGVKGDMERLKVIREQKPVMMKQPFEEQVHLRKEEVKKEEPHPRVGSYESSDVSIEKYFYSGPPKG